MAAPLEVAIAAGGTAGHINPALALAEELRARAHHVTFYGRPEKLEGRLVPAAGFELVPVEVHGFDRTRPWTAVTSLVRARSAERSLAAHFRHAAHVDVAIGFGAYVELPLLDWCRRFGVPYLLHEQNSVPGLANRLMASHAGLVCISVPAAEASFVRGGRKHRTRVVLTGNPVRKSVVEANGIQGRARLGVPASATLLLVFGGSLGARTINEGLTRLKDRLLAIQDLYVVHSTGAQGFEATVANLALTPEQQTRWRVVPYIDNMGDALAAADLVLSRSGASSIAEIAALGVPSVLVPFPYATADHQTINARYLTDAGAAVLFADDEVSGDGFADELLGLLSDPERRSVMRARARGLAQGSAAAKLADEVERLAVGG